MQQLVCRSDLGLAYAHLNQEFLSTIDFNGTTAVTTDIDFYGAGPELGLSAQRRFGCSCLYAYSQGLASFLVGRFDGQYQQSDSFGGVVVDTSWDSGRIVPLLEYELGVGVMSPGGQLRLRAGYLIALGSTRSARMSSSMQSRPIIQMDWGTVCHLTD